MKTILSLLLALIAFTAIPTTQAKADLYNAGGMAAIASQSTVGHGHYRHRHHDHYYGRPHWRGGYRHHYYRRGYYNRGYHRHYYGPRRSGITIRF